MKDDLIRRIRHGAIYLLLGQNYFYRKNPLVESVEKEYGIHHCKRSHDIFLMLGEKANMDWIYNRVNFLLPPPHLKTIFKIPWNGVIVTAVDGIAKRNLSNPWREVQTYYDSRFKLPGSVSDREHLIISELFGEIGHRDLQDHNFPTDEITFLKSKMNATGILSVYRSELASPMTTLIIDGYDMDDDWLEPEVLVSFISDSKGSVHVFGTNSKKNNKAWNMLVERGIITEHSETFAAYLAEKEMQEEINIDDWAREHSGNKLITVQGKTISLPKDLYNEISQDAMIMDDAILLIDRLSKAQEADQFRRFLYNSGQRPVWEGYVWGFCFERVAEEKLYEEVKKQLKKTNIDTPPIILEGQAGSGKSVLLGKIAFRIKNEEEYPIIFIPQMNTNINYMNILNFCNWLEVSSAAKRLLIIWDGSVYNDEISRYVALNDFLISKGKRVLIVGSSLSLGSRMRFVYHYKSVMLSTQLNNKEKNSICEIFNRYSGSSISPDVFQKFGTDNTFVVCYRLLPPSRMNLRRGLVEEGKKNLLTLQEIINSQMPMRNNPFVDAFIKAGFYVSDDFIESIDDSKNISELMEYVCVPAQFGLYIPFNLLLRCFLPALSLSIATKIDEMDFFSFTETADGDWIVGARTRLEAELLLDSEISTVERQIEIIKHLISCVRESLYFDTSHSEMDFLVDLLKAIGPNGRKREVYREYFKEIAEALHHLRSEGISNSRTVLQEATLLREYAKEHETEKTSILKQAQRLLELEIEKNKSNNRVNSSHIGRMYCELASNIGAQIIEGLNHSDWSVVQDLYRKQDRILRLSMDLATESFHGLDICAWTAKGIFDTVGIPESIKKEVYANFVSLYEISLLANPALGDLEDYHARLMEVSEAFGELTVTDGEFRILLEKGSCTGIYLRARKLIREVDFRRPLSDKDRVKYLEAEKFLEKYSENIYLDVRCLYLLFNIKWMLYTGEPILYRERSTLPISQNGWREFCDISDAVIKLAPEKNHTVMKYIRAIALFHLKDRQWIDAFEEISHLPYPSHKRIIVSYLASDSSGKPIPYTGTIISGDERRTRFRIEEIGRIVPYFNTIFARQDYVLGRTYENIELGFNFLGVQISRLQGGH